MEINLTLSVQSSVRIQIPKLPAAFVGTGDLFTALTTAWLHTTDNDLAATLERVIASMQAVLNRQEDPSRFNPVQ